MKLAPLCQWLCRKRRAWLLAAALLLLLPLGFLLPAWLWLTISAPLWLAGAMYGLWRLLDLGNFGPAFMREPTPGDALAQTVLVDAELVDDGLCVQAVAQPLTPVTEMSLRMGSGALLLGTAMTLLADSLNTAERAAIHEAVARLNIVPERLRAHVQHIHLEETADHTALTVQDGPDERVYYMAEAVPMSRLCSAIWADEGDRRGARPITPEDRHRLLDAAAYLAQGGGRVLAFATAQGDERPTLLGLCALGQRIRMDAAQELSLMKSMGLTVMLRDSEDPAMNVPALREAFDIPDIHARPDLYLSEVRQAESAATLTIRPQPGEPLTAPIRYLRDRFAQLETQLTAFALTLTMLLGCCILCGGPLSAPAVTALLLLHAVLRGLPARRLSLPALLLPLGGSLLLRLFLSAVLPGVLIGTGTVLCILLGGAMPLVQHLPGKSLKSLLPSAAALILALICGIVAGATLLSTLLAALLTGILALSAWLTMSRKM